MELVAWSSAASVGWFGHAFQDELDGFGGEVIGCAQIGVHGAVGFIFAEQDDGGDAGIFESLGELV